MRFAKSSCGRQWLPLLHQEFPSFESVYPCSPRSPLHAVHTGRPGMMTVDLVQKSGFPAINASSRYTDERSFNEYFAAWPNRLTGGQNNPDPAESTSLHLA